MNESLLKMSPLLAAEWNYEGNRSLLPNNIHYKSTAIVWWKCPKGHEWEMSVLNRHCGKKCPTCDEMDNSLKVKFPAIFGELHPTKNVGIDFSKIRYGSSKSYWWKCSNGHTWKATVANRTTQNSGCKQCSMSQYNLITSHPEVLQFWDYQNNKVKPEDVFASYEKPINWRCVKGHQWKCLVRSQIITNGCSKCRGLISKHLEKLTDHQVTEIRQMLKEGIYQRIIADKYGVSRGTISNINVGRHYKDIE